MNNFEEPADSLCRDVLVEVQRIAMESGEHFFAGNFARAIVMLDERDAIIEVLKGAPNE